MTHWLAQVRYWAPSGAVQGSAPTGTRHGRGTGRGVGRAAGGWALASPANATKINEIANTRITELSPFTGERLHAPPGVTRRYALRNPAGAAALPLHSVQDRAGLAFNHGLRAIIAV